MTGSQAQASAPPGRSGAVLRIDWLPGTDVLRGTCHCGVTADAEDPVAMWEWLLAHPSHAAGPGP